MFDEPVTPRRTLPPVPPTSRSLRARESDTGRHADLTQDLSAWMEPAVPVHDDAPVSSTGRHAVVEQSASDDPAGTGAHTTGTPPSGAHATGTHRVLVTRPSRRRWAPAGIGATVLAVGATVLLTSGLGTPSSAQTRTDEAARTGSTAPATTAAPTTTEAPYVPPALSTIVITPGTPPTGPATQRSTPAARTTPRPVQPAPAPASSSPVEQAPPAVVDAPVPPDTAPPVVEPPVEEIPDEPPATETCDQPGTCSSN